MQAGTPQDRRIDDLAICYTTFNSKRTITRSLESSRALSDRIVVIDSGSTDGTLEICRDHGVETVHRDWTNPTEQKAFAMSFCTSHAWTLLLDSDETVLEDLAQSIRARIAGATEEDSGFALNRVTWLDGEPLRHAFQPEWRLRLVRSDRARILADPSGVHDRLEVEHGRTSNIPGILRHDSWVDAADMLQRGVSWGVQTGRAAEKGGRPINLLVNPAAAFVKQLILRRAILDGWRGWIAAGGVASQTLAKHIAIMERREHAREDSRSS